MSIEDIDSCDYQQSSADTLCQILFQVQLVWRSILAQEEQQVKRNLASRTTWSEERKKVISDKAVATA
jgi:hypothetical protein